MKKNNKKDNLDIFIFIFEIIKTLCLILIAIFIILVILKIIRFMNKIEKPVNESLNSITKVLSQFNI